MPNFIDGLRVYKPNEKAPDFVKANLSIDCKALVEYMRKNHTDGKMKVDIKLGKTGNLYAELNTWKKPENDFDISKAVATDRGTQHLEQDYPPMPEEEPIDVRKVLF